VSRERAKKVRASESVYASVMGLGLCFSVRFRIFLYPMPMHFFIQLPCLYKSIYVLLLSLTLLACIGVPSNWQSALYRFRVAGTSNSTDLCGHVQRARL
jgi:hypothetical protein